MDKESLKLQALETASDYIVRLLKGIEKCVDLFDEGYYQEALEINVQVIEGLNWVTNVLKLTEIIPEAELNIAEFNMNLKEMSQAYNNKDYVLIKDLFEYEIIPKLKIWEEKINQFLAKNHTNS